MSDGVPEIEKHILESASKCKRNFICKTDPSACCPVKFHLLKDKIIFIDRTYQNGCPYLMTWGYSHICTCPARKELYARYNI